MYRIALCDDEQIFSEEQEKICQNILKKLNIKYSLDVFKSSTEFLNAFLKQQKRFDLMLLDIVMDKPDGMELAHIIRQSDGDCSIVFITANPDFALQGYDVRALHYLIKPVNPLILEKLIRSDYNSRFKNSVITFETKGQKHRIFANDIVCLETTGRKVTIYLTEMELYYPGKLTQLLDELPKDQFVRCHQAFAININKIREITRQDAISLNGKKIPVSRTYVKNVQMAFMKHLRGTH
jgi:DNA-binding LytR/AlgR family response regulator